VQRALTATDMLYPQKLAETLDLLYHAFFVEHQPVHERECLLGLLVKVHGVDKAEEIMKKVDLKTLTR
ncbi:MAG: hypothetical protein Q9181_008190, partial [Wetmoreana brouardii]